MSNCTGCNSCQSCNTGCQVCVSCESIDCNSLQTLCEINCESATEYGGGNPWTDLCFEKNQFITYKNLTAKKIQDAYDWISTACYAGDLSWTASWSGSVSNNTALAAAETDTLAAGLKHLHVTISTKKPNDVIYASYFDDIRSKMNDATIDSDACDECNIKKCEAKCDTCNKCEKCQNCDSITYCGEYCGQYCGLTPPPKEEEGGT